MSLLYPSATMNKNTKQIPSRTLKIICTTLLIVCIECFQGNLKSRRSITRTKLVLLGAVNLYVFKLAVILFMYCAKVKNSYWVYLKRTQKLAHEH